MSCAVHSNSSIDRSTPERALAMAAIARALQPASSVATSSGPIAFEPARYSGMLAYSPSIVLLKMYAMMS